jgi:DHA1 family bicyclomycin/chloramphenicol resistance-like MFS transporter
MCVAVACNIAYCAVLPPALPWTVLPVMIYTVGMALAMPSATLLTLELFPSLRGMTSSLQGFAHSLFAGLTAGLVSPLVSGSALALALTMGALLLPGWLAWRRYLDLAGK